MAAMSGYRHYRPDPGYAESHSEVELLQQRIAELEAENIRLEFLVDECNIFVAASEALSADLLNADYLHLADETTIYQLEHMLAEQWKPVEKVIFVIDMWDNIRLLEKDEALSEGDKTINVELPDGFAICRRVNAVS